MKRFIQFFTLLSFALVISAASASAQTTKSVHANVPFTFSLGQETYAAGNYKLRIVSQPAGGSVVTVSDERGDTLQTVVATLNGAAATGRSELIFERRGSDRYLVGISLPDSGLRFAGTDYKKTVLTKNISTRQNSKPRQS